MVVAGAYGHIEILTSLSDQHGGSLQPKIATYYAASNQIDAIHCLYKMYSFFAVRGSANVAAARHGHLSALKYFHKKRERRQTRPLKVPLLDIAAEGGSLDAVKFIHDHCPNVRCTTEAMDAAAQNGHLDIVRFLHWKRSEGCTVKAMDEASDEFTVLRFLHTHRREGCTTAAIDAAATRGNLKVVKFLHENRKEGCTTNAMDHAALNGYLSTIRYLHEHRTEGCSKKAMRLAIERGKFLVVKFLHQFRTEGCTAAALDTAVLCGHLTIARFLSENHSEGCTKHGLIGLFGRATWIWSGFSIRIVTKDITRQFLKRRSRGIPKTLTWFSSTFVRTN